MTLLLTKLACLVRSPAFRRQIAVFHPDRLEAFPYSRTGVPPVSEIQETSVPKRMIAAMNQYPSVNEFHEDGDRRDACPTCLTAWIWLMSRHQMWAVSCRAAAKGGC